jgi:hypothetical protein
MLRARDAERQARVGVMRASTAIECSEHATRKAMHAAARRERARSPSTSTPRVVDHVSANAPGRTAGSRKHTDLAVTRRRHDRHSPLHHTVDAHLDHGVTAGRRDDCDAGSSHGRGAPRSRRSRRTSITGRRDGRDELCCVAARATGITHRASPSDLPDAPRGPCGETRARDARGRARRRVSTGAQHMTGRARDTRGRVTTALECSEHAMLGAVHEDASRHEHGHRMLRARDAERQARVGVMRASTAIECSEHATRKAMHAAARRERARSPSTSRA